MASTSEVRIELPESGYAVIEPEPSATLPDRISYDVSRGKCSRCPVGLVVLTARVVEKPFNVGMRWPEEAQFEYREFEPQAIRHTSLTCLKLQRL